MRFSICGGNSRGQGCFDFLRFDVKKNLELLKKPKAFILMNYFILLCIEKSYLTCIIKNEIFFGILQIKEIGKEIEFTEKDFKKAISVLKKLELIQVERIQKLEFFKINIL
jgi:hypothetical protein